MSTVSHSLRAIWRGRYLEAMSDVTSQFDAIHHDLGNTYIVDGSSNNNGLTYESCGTINSIDPNV